MASSSSGSVRVYSLRHMEDQVAPERSGGAGRRRMRFQGAFLKTQEEAAGAGRHTVDPWIQALSRGAADHMEHAAG